MSRRWHSAIGLGASILSLPLAGCRSTVRDCNALVQAFDTHGARVNVARKQLVHIESDPAVTARLRTALDEAIAAVRAVDATDTGVDDFRTQYLELLEGVRASADAFDSAMTASDEPGKTRSALVDAAVEADRALGTERDLADRINAYCSGA